MSSGKIVVFCGPSGAGKSTIAHKMLKQFPVFQLSISATTRSPRAMEKDKVDYYFLTSQSFEAKIEADKFLEYEQVYEGLYYGTLMSEMERIWSSGNIPFLDLDVKGAAHLKEKYGDQGLFVFIHPGTVEVLAQRLRDRGTEDARSLEKRIRRASFELEYAPRFDYILKNEKLEVAVNEIQNVLDDFIKR